MKLLALLCGLLVASLCLHATPLDTAPEVATASAVDDAPALDVDTNAIEIDAHLLAVSQAVADLHDATVATMEPVLHDVAMQPTRARPSAQWPASNDNARTSRRAMVNGDGFVGNRVPAARSLC